MKEVPLAENPWLAKPLFFCISQALLSKKKKKDLILIEPNTLF